MRDFISIALSPAQACIILTALEEYQADFEAALHGSEISDLHSINAAADYAVVATECDLVRKTIEIQLGINQ